MKRQLLILNFQDFQHRILQLQIWEVDFITNEHKHLNRSIRSGGSRRGVGSKQRLAHKEAKKLGLTTLASGQTLQGTGWSVRRSTELSWPVGLCQEYPWLQELFDGCSGTSEHNSVRHEHVKRPRDHWPLLSIDLTTRDVTRWKMAWSAFCAIEDNPNDSQELDRLLYKENLLVRRCKDWPYDTGFFESSIGLVFSAVSFIYGGLHALAWSVNFDSLTERLLWRISACVVMGGVPAFHVLIRLDYIRHRRDLFGRFGNILAIVGFILISSAYVLARAYLVVECFINLFRLPVGVYDVPSWSAYFPHIS